jgi:serine/threonine-protein kinase
MANFLDKLNQQSVEGSITSPADSVKKPADTGPGVAPAPKAEVADEPVGMPPKKTAKPAGEPLKPTGTASAPSPARKDEPKFAGMPGGGIKTIEHEIEIDKNYGSKRFLRIMLTIILLLAVAAGFVFAVRYFTMVELPDFEGKTIAEMRKWCLDNKLYLTEKTVYSMEIEENYIISQSIPGGTKVVPKKTIEVTYSLGADPNEKIPVPDLMNMTPPQIREWIDENSLSNVFIYEEYSNEYPMGAVTRYQFGSLTVDETNFRRSDSLTVYVSRGKSVSYTERKLKNFVGSLRSEVESWCSQNGMIAVFTTMLSEEVAEDRIISQSIEPDTGIESGTVIEFVVSEGPGLIVPDYSKVYKEDVMSASQGFNVNVVLRYSATVPYGGFISQSVEAGTRVNPKDNNITVVYSLGKPYLPNFVGMSESSLPELFYEFNRKGASLVYTITYVTSTAQKGTIVKASRNSEVVDLNAVIEFEVSNGLGVEPPKQEDPVVLIPVPDYSSVLNENAAELEPRIYLVIETKYSDTVPYGALISQSVKPGGYVTQEKNRVTLVYSAGKPYIGNLVGRTENELPAIFYEFTKMGASITYEITYVDVADPSLYPKGTVMAVSKSNEYISTNEVIQIQVSKG